MPEPEPDYIFSDMKPWDPGITCAVDIPQYGNSLIFDLDEAGLDSNDNELDRSELSPLDGPSFGQIPGRFSELNGDMRNDAADDCGGEASDWLSLWPIVPGMEFPEQW